MAVYFPKINQLRFHNAPGVQWYMPSIGDLHLMYSVLHLNSIGNFATEYYWSSSEAAGQDAQTKAQAQTFNGGGYGDVAKTTTYRVRAITEFTSLMTYVMGAAGPNGGWIFNKIGNKYYEAAAGDVITSRAWSSNSTEAAGASGSAAGTGLANTLLIQAQTGQATDSSAHICYDISTAYSQAAQNHDNRNPDLNIWPGVTPHIFYQPILKTWNGPNGGANDLDFIIRSSLSTWAAENLLCNVYKVSNGNLNDLTFIETLTPVDFYTYTAGDHVYRFTKNTSAYAVSCYVIKLISSVVTTASPKYESNIFDIQDAFDDCYTFEAWNFENDFGVIFTNSTPTNWYLKLMIPYRMYQPKTKIKKDVYMNDKGSDTTLRTVLNRVYEFESLPVPLWFAELFQMATGLSYTYLNGVAVNFEDLPEAALIQDSNLCVIKGNVLLTDFNDKYILNVT
jgi:hypothetical protein